MCGIVFVRGDLPARARREAAVAALHHRGPDGHGTHEESDVFMGFTRLAILDLSDAADQPMVSPDGRYVLIYNGEIYNYVELRREIEDSWPWRSHGDTEVLLALLTLQGERCLPKLRGMFAFVLWDRERHVVLAGRDPIGIKPLYYKHDGKTTVAASELKVFPTLGAADRLDFRGIESFLLTGSVIAPRTAFEGVRALPPGHVLRVEDGRATEVPYWVAPRAQPTDTRSADELVDDLDARLRESVHLQLRADVPVGTFLSGGLDSTLITSYAAERGGRLLTFSVAFESRDGARWDETDAAQLVSDRYETEHQRVLVTRSEFESSMADLVQAIDQPSMDGPNTYFVAEAASQKVKVALAGHGGDELFAGYNVFQIASVLDRGFARLPPPPAALTALGRRFLRAPVSLQDNWYARAAATVVSGGDPHTLLASTRTLFTPGEIGAAAVSPPPLGARHDLVNEISRLLLTGYLPNTLLRDADAMSMRHSLEVRVPIVDHLLAEFALSIPGRSKVAWGNGKALFRALGRRRLPPELLGRPKAGFSFPLFEWLMHPRCFARVEEVLAPDAVAEAGLVDPRLVARELGRLRSGRRDRHDWLRANRIWSLFVLHEWNRGWTQALRHDPAPPLQAVPA